MSNSILQVNPGPRYHHTHDLQVTSGTTVTLPVPMQQPDHDPLLQKWLSEEDLHTYKAELRSYRASGWYKEPEKTDIMICSA